jgi:hypothetical protein
VEEKVSQRNFGWGAGVWQTVKDQILDTITITVKQKTVHIVYDILGKAGVYFTHFYHVSQSREKSSLHGFTWNGHLSIDTYKEGLNPFATQASKCNKISFYQNNNRSFLIFYLGILT